MQNKGLEREESASKVSELEIIVENQRRLIEKL